MNSLCTLFLHPQRVHSSLLRHQSCVELPEVVGVAVARPRGRGCICRSASLPIRFALASLIVVRSAMACGRTVLGVGCLKMAYFRPLKNWHHAKCHLTNFHFELGLISIF